MQQTTRLSLKPLVAVHDGVARIEAVYEVEGIPNDEIVQINNHRAATHPGDPLWRIHYVHHDVVIGEYKTAEGALAFLQELIDEPNGLMSAFHKAEVAWLEKWNHAPLSEAAKWDYKNDVEPWKKLVRKFGDR
jgi:hypothetical protein